MTIRLLRGFKAGDAVKLAPHTDRWMRGDRVGSVERVGSKWLHVRMFTSGQLVRCAPEVLELAA